MRIQSIVLEYHRDVSVLRLNVIYNLVTNLQFSGRDLFQAGDHSKRCRFAASGRSYEDDELLVFDLKVEVFNRLKSIWIHFVNMFQ